MTVEDAYLRRAAIIVLVGLVALVAGNLVEARVNPDPTRFELTSRCLELEKRFPIYEPAADSAAFSARVDALQTTIEGNSVTIAVVGSEERAEQLARAARASSGAARVERRDDVVYEWSDPPSPTQEQHAYDCEFLRKD